MTSGWRALAACKGSTALFYTERGEPTAEAKAVCAGCPVRAECLDDALEHNERFGVWGGKSERQRRDIAHRRRLSAGLSAL